MKIFSQIGLLLHNPAIVGETGKSVKIGGGELLVSKLISKVEPLQTYSEANR